MIEVVHALFLLLLDIDETILGLRELIRDAQDFAQRASSHLSRAMIPGSHLVQSVALGGDSMGQLRHTFLGGGVRIRHGLLLGVLRHHHRAHAIASVVGSVATRRVNELDRRVEVFAFAFERFAAG